MQSGMHDYDRAEAQRERQATGRSPKLPRPDDLGEAHRRAQARDAVPTLAEVIAASGMILTADGHLVPASVAARGDRGWDGADANRDSGDTVRLAELVRDMDVMCANVVGADVPGAALTLARKWTEIRKITQSNQDRPTGERA